MKRKLTKKQKIIRGKYISLIGRGNDWLIRLTIGCQSFSLARMDYTKKEAEWIAAMLSVALGNLVAKESKQNIHGRV